MLPNRFYLSVLLAMAPVFSNIRAQVNVKDSVLKFTMVHVTGSLSVPQADLKNRFGFF
jgi:molybdopterin synthase catalytic subunit